MNFSTEEILDLIQKAVGEAVEVRSTGPAGISILQAGLPPLRFRLAPWSSTLREGAPDLTLWVLRRPSAAELDRLRDSGQSFVALSGAVRIQAPGLLVDRAGLRRARLSKPGSSRSAFSDRASLVPRAMFSARPGKTWTLSELAQEAGVSNSVTSYAVQDLRDRGLAEVRRSGREKRVRLESRRSLVEEWVREYHWRDNGSLAVAAPVGSPERFLRRLPKSFGGKRWAVTLHAAGALIARHAPVEELHIYLEAKTEADLFLAAQKAGWKSEEKGALHLVSPHYGSSVWEGVREIDGVPVVSTLQLVLDLWNHPIRGREQAERLLANLEVGGADGL